MFSPVPVSLRRVAVERDAAETARRAVRELVRANTLARIRACASSTEAWLALAAAAPVLAGAR